MSDIRYSFNNHLRKVFQEIQHYLPQQHTALVEQLLNHNMELLAFTAFIRLLKSYPLPISRAVYNEFLRLGSYLSRYDEWSDLNTRVNDDLDFPSLKPPIVSYEYQPFYYSVTLTLAKIIFILEDMKSLTSSLNMEKELIEAGEELVAFQGICAAIEEEKMKICTDLYALLNQADVQMNTAVVKECNLGTLVISSPK